MAARLSLDLCIGVLEKKIGTIKQNFANNDFSTRDYYNISLGAKKDT